MEIRKHHWRNLSFQQKWSGDSFPRPFEGVNAAGEIGFIFQIGLEVARHGVEYARFLDCYITNIRPAGDWSNLQIPPTTYTVFSVEFLNQNRFKKSA